MGYKFQKNNVFLSLKVDFVLLQTVQTQMQWHITRDFILIFTDCQHSLLEVSASQRVNQWNNFKSIYNNHYAPKAHHVKIKQPVVGREIGMKFGHHHCYRLLFTYMSDRFISLDTGVKQL